MILLLTVVLVEYAIADRTTVSWYDQSTSIISTDDGASTLDSLNNTQRAPPRAGDQQPSSRRPKSKIQYKLIRISNHPPPIKCTSIIMFLNVVLQAV